MKAVVIVFVKIVGKVGVRVGTGRRLRGLGRIRRVMGPFPQRYGGLSGD